MRVVETHLSRVLLTGDRAFKIKKPVVLPFVDYGTPERRRAACEAEVRLNRRLAPDVYLGVRGIVKDAAGRVRFDDPDAPGVVDYAVEMRRFDAGETLEAHVRSGTASAAGCRALGAWLAAFHAGADVVDGDAAEAVKRALDDTFATLRHHGADVTALERWSSAFLSARWAQLGRRAARGLVRDVHGDLRAEHILVGDGFRAVDCLEFSDALRRIDVGADLAFLVMDLHRLARADLASALVDGYRDGGGDPGDDELLAFHAAARALVRAKVALLQDRPAARLLVLANTFAWRSRGPVIVTVAGVAASGKSTLARALAGRSGFTRLDSDVVRKELTSAPVYDAEEDARTYIALLERAAAAVGGVIVEATFRRRAQREQLAAAAAAAGARLLVAECIAPPAVLAARAAARRGDVSDAGPAVVAAQLRDPGPFDDVDAAAHLPLRTDRELARQVEAVEDALDRALAAAPPPHLLPTRLPRVPDAARGTRAETRVTTL